MCNKLPAIEPTVEIERWWQQIAERLFAGKPAPDGVLLVPRAQKWHSLAIDVQ